MEFGILFRHKKWKTAKSVLKLQERLIDTVMTYDVCYKKNFRIFSQILFFYLKVQSFRLVMENNFIQMAASAGHAVAYTISPIFKLIIGCVQL